jgi:hypothetical protein
VSITVSHLRMDGGPQDGQGVAYTGAWPPLRYAWPVPIWELPLLASGIPGRALKDEYELDRTAGDTVIYRYLGRYAAETQTEGAVA